MDNKKPEMTLGEAVAIVKFHLTDDGTPDMTMLAAIEKVANMETHNSIKKDELVRALRWLFDRYDFYAATKLTTCRDCVHRKWWRNGYRCELNADPYAGTVVDGGDDEFCSYGERATHE